MNIKWDGTEKYILISSVVIGTIWIFSLLLDHLAFPDTTLMFLGKNGRIELTPNKMVTQVFAAKKDNISQLNILIGQDNLGIREKIQLELKDARCSTTIAKETISWWSPDPFIYHHFPFQTITDSKNQSYCLSVTYESSEKRSERPYLFTNEGPEFKEASYIDTGKDRTYEGRSIIFRPAYSAGSFSGNLTEFIHRLSQYKPFFLKDSFLITIIASFILFTQLLAIIVIISSESGEADMKKRSNT